MMRMMEEEKNCHVSGRFSDLTDTFLSLSDRDLCKANKFINPAFNPLNDTMRICILRFISKIFRTHYN